VRGFQTAVGTASNGIVGLARPGERHAVGLMNPTARPTILGESPLGSPRPAVDGDREWREDQAAV
jgi:hypothetical protein